MNVLMPQLGETVTEGTVANWKKKVGDKVAADEIILDIETDKVSMEIPSPGDGFITQILVQEGATVPVGTVLAVVESSMSAAASAPAPAPAAKAAPPSPAPAPAAAAAPASPPSWYAAMPPDMNTAKEQYEPQAAIAAGAGGGAAAHVARDDHQRLSPAVRRLAAEYRIDLKVVPGSGRNGRITRRNVLEFIQRQKTAPSAAPTPAAAAAPAARAPAPAPAGPPTARDGGSAANAGRDLRPPAGAKTVPFTRIRKLTA